MLLKPMALLLMLSAAACGSLPEEQTLPQYSEETTDCSLPKSIVGKVNPFLTHYVQDFYNLAVLHRVTCNKVRHIDASSDEEVTTEMGSNLVVGYCDTTFKDLYLAAGRFLAFNEETRRILIFHELGHCALGLDHASENAINIMNPYVLPTYTFQQYKTLLLDKLFSKSLD